MNTLNSVNSVNSVNKPNKTPARAINFVGNKNKTEDRKTVEVAEALPALLLTLLPQSLLRACAAAVFFLSAHTHTHTYTYKRETATTARLASSASAERSEPSQVMHATAGGCLCVCVCDCMYVCVTVCAGDQSTHTPARIINSEWNTQAYT